MKGRVSQIESNGIPVDSVPQGEETLTLATEHDNVQCTEADPLDGYRTMLNGNFLT